MMHASLLALLLAASSAEAQTGPAVPIPAADADAAAQREARYLRQQVAVDNARQELEAQRAEMKLKDELLILARERNAELYKVASEILARHAKQRSWEPFIQSSRVRMENLIQSYDDRLRVARFTEATLPPSVEERMKRELTPKAADNAQAASPVAPQPK